MASSSGISGTKYDVFISFRGEDVRSDFLSHLAEKLEQKKIDVYVDDRLKRGDEIWPSLVKAIEQSLFSLIIFSKDYASSKWCLKELLKIMKWKDTHGHIVIPIFYHIDPSHVRHQTESYGEAFAKHDQNYNEEEVQSWRSALTKAANLCGFHASNHNPLGVTQRLPAGLTPFSGARETPPRATTTDRLLSHAPARESV